METAYLLLVRSFVYFLKAYFLLLIIRVLLHWLPSISAYDQPFYSISRVTDPYFEMFRDILPVFLGIDLSPIFAFAVIQVLIDLLPRMTALLNF
jgi:YggT family protein